MKNKFQTISDRIYSINGKQCRLMKKTVDRLLYFNKSPTSKNKADIDKAFVELLLLSAFKVSDLRNYILDGDLLKLIKCKLINLSIVISYLKYFSLMKYICFVLLYPSQISTETELVEIKFVWDSLKNMCTRNVMNFVPTRLKI